MQAVSDISFSSPSLRGRRCDCSLQSWVSSMQLFNSLQSLQPSLKHRFIARMMCGHESAGHAQAT